MMQSMTGYGAADHVEGGVCYSAELRSLNNRYLKVSIRLPERLQFLESTVESAIRSRLWRGAIGYTLRCTAEPLDSAAPLNVAVLQRYVDQLSKVRMPAGIPPTLDLGALINLPGVCDAIGEDEAAREQHARAVEQVTINAIDQLVEMRKREGEALKAELAGLGEQIRGFTEQVARRAPLVVGEYHERLRARVATLMAQGGFELEAEGLMKEVAVYADRCDITEELARLDAHLDQFGDLSGRGEPVGRTLEFLAQELLREANTIASKSNNREIARHVVEMKGLIDRLREQVQNVE